MKQSEFNENIVFDDEAKVEAEKLKQREQKKLEEYYKKVAEVKAALHQHGRDVIDYKIEYND